ncbi:MAG: hypothetical protein K6T65_14950, partial [Peptococcaceae bacterium]|nr:hypothetical protein [Peptococcaceae bacterium]
MAKSRTTFPVIIISGVAALAAGLLCPLLLPVLVLALLAGWVGARSGRGAPPPAGVVIMAAALARGAWSA